MRERAFFPHSHLLNEIAFENLFNPPIQYNNAIFMLFSESNRNTNDLYWNEHKYHEHIHNGQNRSQLDPIPII